jgi:SAM-dependent methyltransferase
MLRGTVGDAMTTRFDPLSDLEPLRPFALTRDQPLADARERMIEANTGALPVVDDGEIVGALTRVGIRRWFELEGRLGFALSSIVDEVSPRDRMFEGSMLAYLTIGGSALECIRGALALTGTREVSRILDFACGHGRVLRMLKAAYPEASLVVCDLDPDAVAFCARTFGAEPVLSSPLIGEVELEGSFDLIWCGSLLTHVEASACAEALALFARHLAAPGALAFSVHGPRGAEQLRARAFSYGLSDAAIDALLEGYDASGFGYVDYEDQTGYGIAVCSPAWIGRLVASQGRLEQRSYEEVGWAELQDVVVCSKAQESA